MAEGQKGGNFVLVIEPRVGTTVRSQKVIGAFDAEVEGFSEDFVKRVTIKNSALALPSRSGLKIIFSLGDFLIAKCLFSQRKEAVDKYFAIYMSDWNKL